MQQIARMGIRLIAMITLLMSLGAALPAGAGPPAGPQAAESQIGPVAAIGLDALGNGWAWAAPKPQTFATSFFLRIENGAWRIALDSTSAPAVLPASTHVQSIAVTAQGDEGWATGVVDKTPTLWHLQKGAWHIAKSSTPATLLWENVTISADGSDGWLAGIDNKSLESKLLRLRNGSWDYVPEPATGGIYVVAISPDAKTTWAEGFDDANAVHAAWRWDGKRWIEENGEAIPVTHTPNQIAVDNTGKGWVASMHFRRIVAASLLTRLAPGQAPDQRELPIPVPNPDTNLVLEGVAVDAAGTGWAVGEFPLGTKDEPPLQEELYQPVLVRLRGDTATPVAPASAGVPDGNFALTTIAISPAGGHAWLGFQDGFGQGYLIELHDPWTHAAPPAAALLPGATHCFAEVPYCLRGVFARYWEQHGGLDQFGFPITPEVQEKQGTKTYTVQYTQRARLEYHPENQAPYDVLLGLLGNALVDPRQSEPPFQNAPRLTTSGVQWFPQTQHNVGAPFLAYWNAQGGLPVFGLPRSEAFIEQNAADGKPYLVQYFERNRLEYHPENKGTKFEFLLGLLGAEQFKQTYGYVP
jgi:hypothetical protein